LIVKLANNRIVGSESGSDHTLDASQVLEAASSKRMTVDGVTREVEFDQAISQVRFQHRQLEVSIIAEVKDSLVSITPAVRILGEDYKLLNLTDDHVLIGQRWFPLEHSTLTHVRTFAETKAPEGTIPLAEYPRLYEGISPDLQLIDRVDVDAYRSEAGSGGPPSGLDATLYPYQQTGYEWLSASCTAGIGGILGDEMGLGKTLQVIAVLTDRISRGTRPSLVICPVTIIDNWCRELERFSSRLRFNVHLGSGRARYPGAFRDIDVVFTSYETAVNDLGLFLMIDWDLMVLDEAQYVKNPGSQRSSTLREIPRQACILVTGTPLENTTLDVWSLCDYAIPGYFGNQSNFQATVADSPQLVERALKPLLLRREVADVATDLPERIDAPAALSMFDHERAGYERLLDDLEADSAGGNPLAKLTRLRQYTGHPGLLDPGLLNNPLENSAKLSRLIELVEEVFASDQKAIVFSTFTGLSDLISQTEEQVLGRPSIVMDGRTEPRLRQGVIDDFSNLRGGALLVMHPQTGGVGLNITAANHVFHYTLEWNPAREAQATARAFRRGQELPVFVHRLFYTNTVDELILGKLEAKAELFDQVVTATDRIQVEILARAMSQRRRTN
jgi:SNF2 family DNA or RNA helicase